MRQSDRLPEGFSLVELMLVVTIVAILALVALPLYQARATAAKMTEGITGVGMIRTTLRTHAAGNGGVYPVLAGVSGSDLDSLGIEGTDLDGKYFRSGDYIVTSTASDYTVRVTLPTETSYWYEVDAAGNETRSGF